MLKLQHQHANTLSVYVVTLTSYDNTLTLQTQISSLHIHTDTSSLHDDISLIGSTSVCGGSKIRIMIR